MRVEEKLEEILRKLDSVERRLDSLESSFQDFGKRLDSVERRLDSLESSFYAVEHGIIQGERKRREVRKIREVLYSSYEGFNTRQWIRGVGG